MANEKSFLRQTRRRLRARQTSHWVVAMVLLSGCAVPAAVAHATVRTPTAVAAAFYRWYVMTFRSDHDPMLELHVDARRRVAPALLDEVDALTSDAMSDDDYFLQSADIVRPCRSVDATALGQGRAVADVAVTLGSLTRPPWRLRVSMVKAEGVWMIRRVTKDVARPTAAAAKRALSDC